MYPGLILVAFCTIFRAGPVWRGPETKFGLKIASTSTKIKKQQYIYIYIFLFFLSFLV
jgi:hypothetical protein